MKPKTWTHPKFAHLQRALGVGPAYAAGILQALWHLAATFSEQSGTIVNSSEQLEAWMQTGLDPNVLVEKLVETRWLDRAEDGTLSVHGWVEHRPSYVNDRLRMRNVREQSRTVANNRDSSPPSASDSPSALSSEKSTSPHKKKPPKSPKGDSAVIPAELNTPEFLKAWEDWQAHRTAQRKTLTAVCIQRQLAKCAKMGVDRAVAMINHTIENGWTGLFEPKPDIPVNGNGHRRTPTPTILLEITDGSDQC